VLERGRGTVRPDQPRAGDFFRNRRVLFDRSLREIRSYALGGIDGRHAALGARRRCHRGADVAPAWALLRDRHAAHRLQRANRLSAMGLGGRSVRALRADRTRLALVLSAIPHEQGAVLFLALGAAAGGYLAVWKLRRSRLGFRLQALRDEPDAAASLGIAIARHKVLAFMISAAMMSVAGTFYAQYVLVLDPERLFSAEVSIIVLLI